VLTTVTRALADVCRVLSSHIGEASPCVHLRVLSSVFVLHVGVDTPLSIFCTHTQANPHTTVKLLLMYVASSFGSVGCGVNRSASGVGGARAGAGG
jgi:hypothetical protein